MVNTINNNEVIIGHNTHRYRVDKNWGQLNPSEYPVNDCHEMVIDKTGRIFMLTNETKNNVLIYNNDGELSGYWGNNFPGAHGLSITEENGVEYLFITDIERHQIIKTTLDGKEIMCIKYPKEIADYTSAEQFNPTETVTDTDGNIYVTDGYGLQFIIKYDHQGNYIAHWGGKGNADNEFDCAHGIAIDTRKKGRQSLLITSRNHNAFKRFTLTGEYLETIHLPGSFVCRPVIKGKNIYAAVFRSGNNMNYGSGYITILNENNEVISTPGGTAPEYIDGVLQPQQQEQKIFIHPHDVCIDRDDNLYVCQWKASKTYPVKLIRI